MRPVKLKHPKKYSLIKNLKKISLYELSNSLNFSLIFPFHILSQISYFPTNFGHKFTFFIASINQILPKTSQHETQKFKLRHVEADN